MTNRQQRRAKEADMPKLPKLRNLSGTSECCGNCPKRANENALNWNRASLRMPKIADDNVVCLATPSPQEKHRVDWCSLWGQPNLIRIAKDPA